MSSAVTEGQDGTGDGPPGEVPAAAPTFAGQGP